MKESKIVTFIGGFYIFGGIIVLLSLIFNGSELNVIFDLPNTPDYVTIFDSFIKFLPSIIMV